MAGNQFGRIFSITTYGESHGFGVGVIIDGVPPNIEVTQAMIQKELDRRRPGQSSVTTPRKEADSVIICSGVFEDKTTGAPIHLMIQNTNQKSKDYSKLANLYRPGHADYSYDQKYGIRDYRGGGRSSGRETAARVAAGALAKAILTKMGITIWAHTSQVGEIKAKDIKKDVIESNSVRCGDEKAAKEMIALIESVQQEGDSIGGQVSCVIEGLPVGLGEPAFDKLDAKLAHAMLSIGTVKGIAFGDGFDVITKKGSENNDSFGIEGDEIELKSNHSGGIVGGISTGEPVSFDLAIKPPSSISKNQETVTKDKQETQVQVTGRHDPCICPRVVPVVEAMAAITILDLYLIHKSYCR